jgi:hypothetical protein
VVDIASAGPCPFYAPGMPTQPPLDTPSYLSQLDIATSFASNVLRSLTIQSETASNEDDGFSVCL